MLEFIIFLFGLSIGSFLNVCIYRLPQNQSVIFPASHCTMCGERLKALDLIPLISYLLLQGHCRYCGAKFTRRYPLVELLTACLFVYCLKVFGVSLLLLKALILTSFLIVITYIDFDHQLILDKVLIWLAGTGVIINLILDDIAVLDMLLAGAVGGGLFLAVALVSRGGMGGGDIKFVAALGLWLGLKATLLTILLAFIAGGIGGIIMLICKMKKRKDYIPFGPFISFGAFVSLVYGTIIINWYITEYL
ncbi:Type 4 prepilin-like proteins leader peptide-processing enzyme [bioreactor metagenome]|uniref:Type 4 prepilin-like proteins leader peptide-processing enzyme n=1 Tax=bioreactor metagenome TaxID=1076179 RepID=A0A644T1S1_9ZZZZ|nr:prepilin peptidase [Negativicutes bacterium]